MCLVLGQEVLLASYRFLIEATGFSQLQFKLARNTAEIKDLRIILKAGKDEVRLTETAPRVAFILSKKATTSLSFF